MAGSSGEETVNRNVAKLTIDNYFSWALKVKQELLLKDVWEAVIGYEDSPGFVIPQTETRRRARNNVIALAVIFKYVGENFECDIAEIDSAKVAWKKLDELCNDGGLVNGAMNLKQLTHFVKPKDMSVQEYFAKINQLWKKTTKAGYEFTERQVAGMVIGNLTEEFTMCVPSLEAEMTSLTLSKVKARLLTEERRKKLQLSEIEANASKHQEDEIQAMVVQQKHQIKKVDGWHTPVKTEEGRQYSCYNCGKLGHVSKYCRSASKCFNCGKLGHHSKVCREPRREESPQERKSVSASGKVVNSEVLHIVDKAMSMKVSVESGKGREWLFDSCASHHMCPYKEMFADMSRNVAGSVEIGDNSKLDVKGVGKVTVRMTTGWLITFTDVLYVPNLGTNLVSVGKLTNKGFKVRFSGENAVVLDEKGKETLFTANRKNDVYIVQTEGSHDCTNVSRPKCNNVTQQNFTVSRSQAYKCVGEVRLWHERYGHAHPEALFKLPVLELKRNCEMETCSICIQGKLCNKGVPKYCERRAEKPLDVVHTDVIGKINPPSLGQAQYVVTMIDEYSRYNVAICVKTKDEVLDVFCRYQANAEKLQGVGIGVIQSDNGTEYTCSGFQEQLKKSGITHRRTVPYTPQQNGIAERQNRTMFDTVRCLLIQSGLPREFWGEAVMTAVHVRNRCPSSAINFQVPYELWYNKEMDEREIARLKVFGCQAWALRVNKTKLDSRAELCVMVGYEAGTKDGYRLWSLERKKVIVRRSVIFVEEKFPFKEKGLATDGLPRITRLKPEGGEIHFDITKVEGPTIEVEFEPKEVRQEIEETLGVESPVRQSQSQNESNVGELVPNLRRSARHRTGKTCACCNAAALNVVKEVEHGRVTDPTTVDEAMSSLEHEKWTEAMKVEMNEMKKRDVWEIVERPENVRVIGSKWIFSLKQDSDGNIQKYKARLVAQGYKKQMNFTYDETFSPVMKRKSMRLLLGIAVEKYWVVEHLDVTNAYLNSHISCTVYMEQPELFEEGDARNYVCKLKKSIYGLPNSSKDWNACVDTILKKLEFKKCIKEPCVYVKGNCIIGLYVDDVIVIGSEEAVKSVKHSLADELEIKDLGKAANVLSIKVEQTEGRVMLSQKLYIEKVISDFGMTECKPSKVILPSGYTAAENDEQEFDSTIYRSAVGSLLHLSNNTRPDLAFAVSKVSQKCQSPKIRDWKEIKHIIRYLSGTKDLKLCFQGHEKFVQVFCDADWGADTESRKSVSGYVTIVAGGAMSWYSKKQSCVARSTMDAEYMAMAEVSREVIWVKDLLSELGMEILVSTPCKIYADNAAAIKMSKHDNVSERSKHVDIMYHVCRELVEKKIVEFLYVPSENNVADLFTKNLASCKVEKFCSLIGLR